MSSDPSRVSAPMPERAADTSPERPWPVRVLSMKISAYVDRMPSVWVEGQLVQLSTRSGSSTCYLTLRDPEADLSLSATIPAWVLDSMPTPVREGARVVLQAKPSFWARRGTLQLEARAIRPVGEGELMARLEHLKRVLAAEGLFEPSRKRALPFLPRVVGLVCGRDSAAERDVVETARRRWPSARFEIRQVPVQGAEAALAVAAATAELDAQAGVDVIVITRGGGSFEDLLPFSNEALIRAVAATLTPVVSAIGHDVDVPLLDFVADVRASTPTDAGKRVVPDARVELTGVDDARRRARRAVTARLGAERRHLESLRSRPVLADPMAVLTAHRDAVNAARVRARRRLELTLQRSRDHVDHLRAQVGALSPAATLSRGYAVVRHTDGRVVRRRSDLEPDELLRVRVWEGDFAARAVIGPERPVTGAPDSSPTGLPDSAPTGLPDSAEAVRETGRRAVAAPKQGRPRQRTRRPAQTPPPSDPTT